jgi:competence protein ComEC
MRDAFTPVFLLALALLLLVQGAAPAAAVFRVLALAAFTLFLGLFVLAKNRAAYALAALALASLLASAYLRQREEYDLGRAERFPAHDYVTLRGRLLAFPEIGRDRSHLKLSVDHDSRPGGRGRRAIVFRVAVSGDLRGLDRGDRLEIDARVDPRRPSRNFFPSAYESFLLSEGIEQAAFCKSAQLVRVTGRANFFWRFVGAWRNRVRGTIEKRYLGADGTLRPQGVFLEATLLGDRGRLENGEQEALIGSGVFHLLAISGGNIAMLALVALFLLRRLRLGLKARTAVAALLLLLYLALSGFDVSAERAVLMALLVFAGRVWFMDVEPANILSFCGLLLLAANPAQFLDPGFALTFALTAAILAGRPLFLPRLRALPRWAAEVVAANVSAGLMALPLSLFFFQRYAFSGLLSGLLLAPLAAGITVCGVLLLPLSWLPAAASAALLPAGVLLDLFFAASGWIAGHAGLNIFRPSPPLWLVALGGAAFFALGRERLGPLARGLAAALLAGLLLFVSLPPRRYRPRGLELYVLDVGHGDAIVAVPPNGDALLVDSGGSSYSEFQVGRRLVLPFLLQKRIRVRWAVASHFHPDHAEGLAEVLPIIKPQELWLASSAVGDGQYEGLLAARPAGTRLVRVCRGFTRSSGGVTIACLAPPAFIESEIAANGHSMVLRVTDGRFSFLLPGDLEKEGEAELAAAFGPGLASTVLKVPHHGSRTSSSDPLLAAAAPRLAVISSQAFNSYGFPHREVIARLKQRGIRWLNTAQRGGIKVAMADGKMDVEVSK